MKDNAVPYLLTALGALAVYMMLPSPRPRRRTAILFTGTVSLLGLIVLYGTSWATSGSKSPFDGSDLMFVVFAGSAVLASALMITQQKPVYAALWFVMVVLSVSGLLILLGAQFLAAVVIVVYVGAILVTYLFVIMLAVKAGMPEYDTRAHRPVGACLTAFLLMCGFWTAMTVDWPASPQRLVGDPGAAAAMLDVSSGRTAPDRVARAEFVTDHTAAFGRRLFSDHMIALQAAGVLLLTGMAGALVIAQKRLD